MNALFFGQNGSNQLPWLSVSTNTLNFIYEPSSNEVTVYIIPNITPTITKDGIWISTSYNATTNKLTISVLSNESSSTRTGSVTLTHPNDNTKTAIINISQIGIP